MANWVLTGLRSGIRTTVYPTAPDASPGASPGRPRAAANLSAEEMEAVRKECPTEALVRHEEGIAVNHGRCVHCFRCRGADAQSGIPWNFDYEWGSVPDEIAATRAELDRAFSRSLHVRFVDAGACGACMSEARQINSPYYNMHSLGFFITPTPRAADVLLIAGPISDAMRFPLIKAYDAMATPKRVVAIGACAISGGVFGPSFAALGGAGYVLPVDVVVPGCPPPPLAILHGLLTVVKRKPAAELISLPIQKEAAR